MTPEFIVGPGGAAPPEVEDAQLFAATILNEPVLILLPRFTVTQIARDGSLVASDAFAAAMRSGGAKPLVGPDLDGPFAPGWVVRLDVAAGMVRITGPGDLGTVYDGDLDIHTQWHRQVVDCRRQGLVMITGSAAATPAAALKMIADGRASWVRASVELATNSL